MRNFIFGAVVALIVFFGGTYSYLRMGLLNPSAQLTPSNFEHRLANRSLDASVDRLAPKRDNPVTLTDANLLQGARVYEQHCALCHGSADKTALTVEDSLYPRAPLLLRRAIPDPPGNVYWIIANGVRWTGMPGWTGHLSDEDMWGLVLFLKSFPQASPGVKDEWLKYAVVLNGHEQGHEPNPATQLPR